MVIDTASATAAVLRPLRDSLTRAGYHGIARLDEHAERLGPPVVAGVGRSTLVARREHHWLVAAPRSVFDPRACPTYIAILRLSMALTAPIATLVLTLAGPGPQPSALEPELPPADPIVGGERTGELEYGSIVAILTSQSALCTGTVVAPRLILTAGHCLADLPPVSNLTVFYGDDVEPTMSGAATGYGTHPELCRDCKNDAYDYGYVTLGVDFVPPDGFILPITDQEEWDATIRKGGAVTLVGFGEDPDAVDPLDSLGTKRKVDTTITRFSTLGLEFFAGGDGHDTCRGDSGGPALVRLEDGTLRLAGITSRGSDPCGKGGFYGAPFAALTWIRDETGVDLLPADCEDGDCLDMTPPAEDDGRCAVASPGRATPPWSLLLLLVLVRRPRRARSR
jgi:hypothetical protein